MNAVKNRIKILPGYREDLRKVYLAIHGSAIVTDIPTVASELGLKRQYVKELFGILADHEDSDGEAFALINRRAGEENNDTPHDWWQTGKTVDQHDNEAAQHWFDDHFVEDPDAGDATKTKAPKATVRATNPADLPLCLCGCNQPVSNRNRNYRPGHDARHAGAIGKALGTMHPEEDEENWTAMLGFLPTAALQDKANNIGRRIAAKRIVQLEKKMQGAAKAINDKIAPVEFQSGKIKIGRWEYDAEKNMTSGSVTYTTGKGVPKVATDEQAKRFYPGSTTTKEA